MDLLYVVSQTISLLCYYVMLANNSATFSFYLLISSICLLNSSLIISAFLFQDSFCCCFQHIFLRQLFSSWSDFSCACEDQKSLMSCQYLNYSLLMYVLWLDEYWRLSMERRQLAEGRGRLVFSPCLFSFSLQQRQNLEVSELAESFIRYRYYKQGVRTIVKCAQSVQSTTACLLFRQICSFATSPCSGMRMHLGLQFQKRSVVIWDVPAEYNRTMSVQVQLISFSHSNFIRCICQQIFSPSRPLPLFAIQRYLTSIMHTPNHLKQALPSLLTNFTRSVVGMVVFNIQRHLFCLLVFGSRQFHDRSFQLGRISVSSSTELSAIRINLSEYRYYARHPVRPCPII